MIFTLLMLYDGCSGTQTCRQPSRKFKQKVEILVMYFYWCTQYKATKQKNKSEGKQIQLIYEKDVSEHCRRRVLPSIFLGRQVIETNARIMQFSRLDLPYSCYISIRTESGSSMVMMIQVTSTDVQESCKDSNQLMIYEMAETFGGYWGPLPETVLKRAPLPPKPYTLKTTHVITTTTESLSDDEEEETDTTQSTTASSRRSSEQTTGDYVEVEVPLLNVSVHYLPAKEVQTETPNTVDTFDLHNDVTPIPGVAYDRTILPLVQFHLIEKLSGRRSGYGSGEIPKHELDIVQDFTPDMRLTMPQLNPTSKRRNKQKYQSTRRLNFKKHRTLFLSHRYSDRRLLPETITRNKFDVTKYSFPTIRNVTKDKSKYTQDSWRVIEDLLKNLNKTTDKMIKSTMSIKQATLLERIAHMDPTKSVYLSPNLSQYGSKAVTKLISTINDALTTWAPVSLLSKLTEEYVDKEPVSSEIRLTTSLEDTRMNTVQSQMDNITKSAKPMTEKLQKKNSRTDQHSTVTVPIMLTSTSSDRKTFKTTEEFGKNVTEKQSDTSIATAVFKSSTESGVVTSKNKLHENKIVTGSMVGHESWENVVQAAPEMAVLLNQSVADDISRGNIIDDITKDINGAPHKNMMLKRKKKNIHSIAIENAQPHELSTRKVLTSTTQLSFDLADMQEFAQLVELQDDELQGRIALRQLDRYVGLPLFNLCNVSDPTKPYLHLFNASRIVLSPTNFTFDSMVVIITAAKSLLNRELPCPKGKIECQVSGTRVCLDTMVACDGVPNCGSYDIYDEDRLMCGYTAALQRNVYLAALTFLAVLLTVIYAVHYWLKRCVPKIADAFFIYSDGIENVLYLDSIMRSPRDIGDDPKMVYHSRLYGDDIYDDVGERHKNACLRFLRKLCCCCQKTHNKINEKRIRESNVNLATSRKMYSFTELEIRKMIATSKDTAVQTGDSIEMRSLENCKDKRTVSLSGNYPIRSMTTSHDFSVKITDSLLTLEEPLPEERTDELSLLKFFNAASRNKRNSSMDVGITPAGSDASKESIPVKIIQESHNRLDSPSEREIEIHSYDRLGQYLSEPGPSNRGNSDKGQIPSSGSISKHLRFDEVTTTIPTERYSDDGDINTNADGRRMAVLGDKRRQSSRLLDTIEEGDEHGSSTKEHRHLWGSSKSKKPKKKTQVNLR